MKWKIPTKNKLPYLLLHHPFDLIILQEMQKEKLTEVGFLLIPISVNPPWFDANPTERIELSDWRIEFRRSRRSRWRWRDLLYQQPAANATNRRAAPTVPSTATVTTSSLQLRGSMWTLGSERKGRFSDIILHNCNISQAFCIVLLPERYIFITEYFCMQWPDFADEHHKEFKEIKVKLSF
jgi:hypothetical protein